MHIQFERDAARLVHAQFRFLRSPGMIPANFGNRVVVGAIVSVCCGVDLGQGETLTVRYKLTPEFLCPQAIFSTSPVRAETLPELSAPRDSFIE